MTPKITDKKILNWLLDYCIIYPDYPNPSDALITNRREAIAAIRAERKKR